jgi:dienelactone hydrolase
MLGIVLSGMWRAGVRDSGISRRAALCHNEYPLGEHRDVSIIGERYLALVILAAATCIGLTNARADELVKFDSAPYILGQFQQRLAIERGEMAVSTANSIEGYLSKPDGDGPFPAVVYLHGCSGLNRIARKHFSDLLTGWAYVSLAVDSFTSRGFEEACRRPMPDRQADAWGALLYLSKLPFVDRERIAVLGSSQGGIVAMRLASTHDVKLFDVPDGLSFKAAVAFYPICSVASERLAIPALILIGELDDWTPAKNCEQWMSLRKGKGAPVKLVVYPGAYHAFDFAALGASMWRFDHLAEIRRRSGPEVDRGDARLPGGSSLTLERMRRRAAQRAVATPPRRGQAAENMSTNALIVPATFSSETCQAAPSSAA